jgi:enoyl-CoA hydratase
MVDAITDKVGTREYADGKMLSAVDDGVGLIIFNQPAKRNAMSVDMWDGLVQILDAFLEDSAVRVVILTGAGHKAFVSGADISQFDKQRSNADAQQEYDKLTSAGRAKLAAFPKPVIARIRGFCLGGGLGIAMQADLRIAAEDSEFGIPAARLGIAYGPDMVSKLVDLVGPAHARMILYTGTRFDAAEAQRIGLINRMVADDELSDVVIDIARTIADNAPLSIAASKITVSNVVKDAAERDTEATKRAIAACFDSADYREGRTAFMEKRPPKFQGR